MITKVLFGANGIDEQTGEIAHGLGHLAIADMAQVYEIPIYVIAESMKIGYIGDIPATMREGPWYPTDLQFSCIKKSDSYNPREERVPFSKIRSILTEKGSYPPKQLNEISSDIDEFHIARSHQVPD